MNMNLFKDEISKKNEVEYKLRRFIYELRKTIPRRKINFKKIGYYDDLTTNLQGNSTRRYLVELRAIGCEWALKGGGCSMCGYIVRTT